MNKNITIKLGVAAIGFAVLYYLLKHKPQVITSLAQAMPSLVPIASTMAPATTYDVNLPSYTPHDYTLPSIQMGGVSINKQQPCNLCFKERQSIAPASNPVSVQQYNSLWGFMGALETMDYAITNSQLPFGGGG